MPPVVQAPQVAALSGAPTDIHVMVSDDDGDALVWSIQGGPLHGTGEGAYWPGPGVLSFTASDGWSSSNPLTVTASTLPEQTPLGQPVLSVVHYGVECRDNRYDLRSDGVAVTYEGVPVGRWSELPVDCRDLANSYLDPTDTDPAVDGAILFYTEPVPQPFYLHVNSL